MKNLTIICFAALLFVGGCDATIGEERKSDITEVMVFRSDSSCYRFICVVQGEVKTFRWSSLLGDSPRVFYDVPEGESSWILWHTHQVGGQSYVSNVLTEIHLHRPGEMKPGIDG